MKGSLRKTIISGIAVLTSMQFAFGSFTTNAQNLSGTQESAEVISAMEGDNTQIPLDTMKKIKNVEPEAQSILETEENKSNLNPEIKSPQENKENIAVIDKETQEEYNLLQDYFKYRRFEKYEEKFEKLEAFKKLAEFQRKLNETYYTKDEKAKEEAGIRVTRQEAYINKRFNLNRPHTGIKKIEEEIAELEKGMILPETENIEGSEEKEAFDLAQEYLQYRELKGYNDKQEKLKAFKELEKLQRDLNRANSAKNIQREKELTEDVFKKEEEINERFNMNKSHTGIKILQQDIAKLEKGLDIGVSQDLERVKKALEKKGIVASYFDCYNKDKSLTLEKYSEIMKKIRENKLKGKMFERFVCLERILEYEDYIDKITKKFEVDKKEILEIWNQESELAIWTVGGQEERGLAQFRPITAQLIAKGLGRDSDFKKSDYTFEKLSYDYELNIIMTAAQLASASNTFNYRLKKAKLTFDQFYELVKEKGRKCTFSKIKEAKENPETFNLDPEWGKILEYYVIADDDAEKREKRIRTVQKVYEDKEGLLKDAIKYIIHNGGGYAVNNIREDSFLSELLLYHLAVYVNNLRPLYKLVRVHYGDLFNIVQKNRDSIERLEVGGNMNLWGVNVSKHDIKQLQKYIEVGLLNKPLDERLKGERIIVIADDHLLDENMSVRCKLDAYHNLVLDSFRKVGKEYEKLKAFKDLESLQETLNEAYSAKNGGDVEKITKRVYEKEAEINKQFNLNRKHTGIKGIRVDIAKIEEKITNYGFKPDLEAYGKTKGFNLLLNILK